jgi:hypothetical protein
MSYLLLLKQYYHAISPLYFMISMGRELVCHPAYYQQFKTLQKLLEALYYKLTRKLIWNSKSEKWEKL